MKLHLINRWPHKLRNQRHIYLTYWRYHRRWNNPNPNPTDIESPSTRTPPNRISAGSAGPAAAPWSSSQPPPPPLTRRPLPSNPSIARWNFDFDFDFVDYRRLPRRYKRSLKSPGVLKIRCGVLARVIFAYWRCVALLWTFCVGRVARPICALRGGVRRCSSCFCWRVGPRRWCFGWLWFPSAGSWPRWLKCCRCLCCWGGSGNSARLNWPGKLGPRKKTAKFKTNSKILQILLQNIIPSLKNLFHPTRRSNTSHKTNYLSFFSLLNLTLNFQNWHLFFVSCRIIKII